MLKASKILLIIAGLPLIFDATLIMAGNTFNWPLLHPFTLIILGAGIIPFAFGSKAFKRG